jgi:hypothetical protein
LLNLTSLILKQTPCQTLSVLQKQLGLESTRATGQCSITIMWNNNRAVQGIQSTANNGRVRNAVQALQKELHGENSLLKDEN